MIDVCIIGCGPAGMSASIYLKRFNYNVLVFEKDTPGGMVTNTDIISNYPGFEKITGSELALNMYMQMSNLSVSFTQEKVSKIEKINDESFIVYGNKEYKCRKVIIATGTNNKTLGLESEKKFFFKGISWCSVCDGLLYKDKVVCVVGGGNSAVSSAIYLSKICKEVYLVHRRDTFRCEDMLLEEASKIEKIKFLKNKNIINFIGNEVLEKIEIQDVITKEITTLEISCLFEAIGKTASSALVDCDKDANDFIIVNSENETSIKGIYAIGDVVSKKVRQIATATADGVIASFSINSNLK